MPIRSQVVLMIVVAGNASCGGSMSSVTADAAARESGPGPEDASGSDRGDASAPRDGAIERSESCSGVTAIRAVGDLWALKLDGSAWRWGVNATGQLG